MDDGINVVSPATFDEIRAILRESAEIQAASNAEYARWRQESNAENERRNAEYARWRQESNADFDRRIKKLEESIGSINNNVGRVTEYFFVTSFEQGKRNFFGEEFYELRQNVGGMKIAAEYDIVLINGSSIAIIEVKYKAHVNDISKVLKKADTIRINFPEYQNHKVYLGLASMAFYPDLEQACIEHGVAIVKQVGETIALNYENLKAY